MRAFTERERFRWQLQRCQVTHEPKPGRAHTSESSASSSKRPEPELLSSRAVEPESDTIRVTEADVGKRLDALLAQRFPAYSRVRLRQLINAVEVTVNQRQCKAAYRVRLADHIVITFPPRSPSDVVAEDIPLDILYDDDRMAVINKRSGMVVHPSKGHWSGTLTAALAFHFEDLSKAGGSGRPGIVHRLDRDTSGVIAIAKDDQAHLNLSQQFADRTVEKEYYAVARGNIDRDRDWIRQPIGPHPYQREKMAIRAGHPASREASTFYEVDERFRGFLSFKLFPKTGRTHQLRVHLAHLGCPIVCDPLYSGYRSLTRGEIEAGRVGGEVVIDRLALHARRLTIDHPTDGRRMTFEAPVPPAITEFLAELPR